MAVAHGRIEMSIFLGQKLTYATILVRWYSPYTQPPDGKPRILWAASIPWPFDGDYLEIIPFSKCGVKKEGKYSVVLQNGDLKPMRSHSAESKSRQRIGNLKRRISKKAPLFADHFMDQEISKKPEYYDPEAIKKGKTTSQIIAEIESKNDQTMMRDLGYAVYGGDDVTGPTLGRADAQTDESSSTEQFPKPAGTSRDADAVGNEYRAGDAAGDSQGQNCGTA